MTELVLVVLASGVKGVLESPFYLIGIPLLALGALGVAVAASPIELRWPDRPADLEAEIITAPEGHPTAAQYIRVGLILGVITAIEVAVYYVDVAEGLFLAILLALSVMKFVLVVLWFMHLYFDNRMFSILFGGALSLVLALFLVVLATLGSNLI
jgi:cytochrome c oxidase subunit 4